MYMTAEKQRKSFRDLFGHGRAGCSNVNDVDLPGVRGDIAVRTSPKVYESGLITSLDLRLVDVNAECEPDRAGGDGSGHVHDPGRREHALVRRRPRRMIPDLQ